MEKKKIRWEDLTEAQREEYINQDSTAYTKDKFWNTVIGLSEEKLTDFFIKYSGLDTNTDVESKIVTNAHIAELKKIINNSLSKRQRSVMRLSLSGYSYDEISSYLDIPNTAVYDAMYRAKKKIKKKMKQRFV